MTTSNCTTSPSTLLLSRQQVALLVDICAIGVDALKKDEHIFFLDKLIGHIAVCATRIHDNDEEVVASDTALQVLPLKVVKVL